MNEKSLIPPLRFAEFTDAWERRKLEDAIAVCSGRDYKSLCEGSIPVYGTGGYMLSVNKALSYDEDAIGIGRKGTIDKPYILKAPFWTVDTLFFAIPRTKFDLHFIHGVFLKIDWKKKDESTGVPSLSKATINITETFIPKEEEQRKIGNLLQSIDRLITLHQRKHEKLLNIKKSMLEKMFPKNGELFPEVRFAGYTNAWERRKLRDFVESLPSKKYITAPTPDGKIEIIQQGNVPIIGYANGIPCDDYENITVFGDHTVSIYKPHKPFFLATDGTKLLSARSLDGDFFYFLLERYKPIPEGYKRHYTILIERYGCFPCRKEQKQIAILLKHIDTLITLHQRKLEKLQNIKKACLEKMFV